MSSANATAAGLLGIDPTEVASHHFTDFIVPGTLQDSVGLFRIVALGEELLATILLRPTSGDVIAIDLHAVQTAAGIEGVFQLAGDVDVSVSGTPSEGPREMACTPAADVAFRGYAMRALARMPEPTPDGLELRLRRLYPHATVAVEEQGWVAQRDRQGEGVAGASWWQDAQLPRVRYDAQALILEANPAAHRLFGKDLVGRYWQELVMPGSTEQVAVMLEILAEVGAAESRFRMPRADGSLVEFDSYTEVTGEELITVIRAIEPTVAEPDNGEDQV
jgi:PAS domain-containing protein